MAGTSMTTMKIDPQVRDRLRALHPDLTLNDAVAALLDAAEADSKRARALAFASRIEDVHGDALRRLGE